MKIDKTDVKIILNMLFINKTVTTTELAKIVYNINSRKEMQDKDSNIRKRLNKLCNYGILDRHTNNGKSYYSIKKGSIFLGIKGKDYLVWYEI